MEKDCSPVNNVVCSLKLNNPLKSKNLDEIFEYINREDRDSMVLLSTLKSLDSFRASSMSRGAKKVMR